jgi:hypothetical protein
MIDPADLAAEGVHIERLLEDLRALVSAPVMRRVEEVMARVVRLYGAGLAHALEHARAAGAAGSAFDDRLAGDELLASLLVLHGLHPTPAERRVRDAIGALHRDLGVDDGALSLVSIEDGVVHLAVADDVGGGAMGPELAENLIRRAIEAAAPELRGIELSGRRAPRAPDLVHIRLHRQTP